LQAGQHYVSHADDPDLSEFDRAHLLQYGAQTALHIPLRMGDRIIGFAELWESRQRRRFTPEEIDLCRGIAQQAAIAIEKAGLYEKAQHEIRVRARAEKALRESEERFRSIFENSVIGMYRTSCDGRILMANPTLVRMLGYSSFEELAHRDLDEEGYEPSYPRTVFKQRMESEGRVVGLESAWQKKDGSTLFIRESASAVRDEAGTVLYYEGTVEDISQRVRAEEALKTHTAQLERSNRELRDFLYATSHHLQEPLRKVQTFSSRMQTSYGKLLDERGRGYLARTQNTAARMQALINALQTHMQVTTQPHPFEPVDLTQAVSQVVSDLNVRIEKAGARVEVEGLPTIDADPTQMRQLLHNLIDNALKFHREDSPPVVKVRTHAGFGETLSANGHFQIVVEDNGIGFDDRHVDRIFQVFQRLHGRSDYEGTGIGLATCRKIVERHGGSISAQSAPGQGARFIVSLPLRQERREDEGWRKDHVNLDQKIP
jgi:two-component system sensor kinase FixL